MWEHVLPVGAGRHVTIKSDLAGSWGGTCGANLWASSTSLVAWLSAEEQRQYRTLYEGRSVLELGAGLGLTGLALDQMGARRVLLTDVAEQIPLLQHNVEANVPLRGSVSTAALRWGEALPPSCQDSDYDLVVATDVIYDEENVAPLASTLKQLSSPRGIKVLLALPDRCEFGPEDPASPAEGATTESVPCVPDYGRLFALLPWMQVQRIGRISSEEAGTCESEIHIFLLTAAESRDGHDRPRRTRERSAHASRRLRHCGESGE